MAEYGRGLNRGIVAAVNAGVISEPFCMQNARSFAEQKGWDVPQTYLQVCLANGASETHSQNYRKYFVSKGDGLYELAAEYRGVDWT